ncbi:MAG TPA: cyclic nucleotide-binding domain-containing protein [Candidatus Competibacteraceae bacterium]|nr:cyclic nucleotide-binding domain-containing protein [Candidatus Competibacteraceae bacterium]
MPIFGGIHDAALTFLLDRTSTVAVAKGDYFFREGDQASAMFVLEEGRVAVLKAWQGRDYLLRYLETGDCFGEMALIDLGRRSASVCAVTDCSAIEISVASLYELYQQDPTQFAMIHMNLERELSRRLREVNEQLFQARMQAGLIGEEACFRPL